MEYVVIGLGGFLGANARYVVANWAAQRFGALFPYGTFIINMSGSFILAFFLAYLQERAFIHPHYRLFFAVGFLGAYTTFSTFTYESLRLVQEGSIWLALVNLMGSVVVGMIGAFFGFVLGGLI
ncbi:MAG TPA: fluoride efflux transporter CrcB [Methylomirabilota bacterium]|jgi:CrcB protein|nr:fluoride efflux transporter CrcB [Methylomirabilota bacterium]